eukprot:768601-Hanusia_phi.AAC.7
MAPYQSQRKLAPGKASWIHSPRRKVADSNPKGFARLYEDTLDKDEKLYFRVLKAGKVVSKSRIGRQMMVPKLPHPPRLVSDRRALFCPSLRPHVHPSRFLELCHFCTASASHLLLTQPQATPSAAPIGTYTALMSSPLLSAPAHADVFEQFYGFSGSVSVYPTRANLFWMYSLPGDGPNHDGESPAQSAQCADNCTSDTLTPDKSECRRDLEDASVICYDWVGQ